MTLLESQLSVVRYPVAEDMAPLINGVTERFGDIPDVVVHQLDEEPRMYTPALRLIRRNDITTRAQILPDIPYETVRLGIERNASILQAARSVTLASVQTHVTSRNIGFVTVQPEQMDMNSLFIERQIVVRALQKTANMTPRPWATRYIDLTMAHTKPEAPIAVRQEMAAYISTLLPMQVRFKSAVVVASPSLTPKD
jgi:hypothetical protein